MHIDKAITHYGTGVELARQLGVTSSVFSLWRKRYGGRVPELYARRLHDMTGGELKFDPADYEPKSAHVAIDRRAKHASRRAV